MADRLREIAVSIPAGATGLSAEVNLGGEILVGIHLPTAATWTTAAVSFQAATVSGGTFQDVYDNNNAEVTLPSSAGARFFAIPPTLLMGAHFIKIRSGTTGAATNQTNSPTVTLVTRQAS